MAFDRAAESVAPSVGGGRRWWVDAQRAFLVLMVVYLVALLALPADLGVRLVGVVWSPARIILIAMLVMAVLTGKLGLTTIRAESRGVLAGWVLFLGAATVTTMLGPSSSSVARLLSMCLEGVCLYLLIRAVAVDPGSIRTLIITLVATTAAIGLATLLGNVAGFRYDSVISALFGAPVTDSLGESRFGFLRQEGPFPAPLFFAIWMAAAASLALPWTISTTMADRTPAVLAWLSLLIEITVLTVSRIAFTGLLVLSGLYLMMWRRRVIGLVLILAGVAAGIGLAGVSVGIGPTENSVVIDAGGVPQPGGPPTDAEVLDTSCPR